jgi:tight adherence protein B
MGTSFTFILMALLAFGAIGGVAFAFSGESGASKKRIASASRGAAAGANLRNPADAAQQKKKNVQALLKDLEKQQADKKQRPTLRKRIEQAGLHIEPRTYWILSATAALAAVAGCLLTKQSMIAVILIGAVAGLGLPRWVLSFLRNRRQKKFTAEFANAIDVIVRSVKSGLPTNEALKIIAKDSPDPVGSEFTEMCESMKVGVTLEQALKKMYDHMPTPEVSFFAIVMTIQGKSGGNLSEALSNLANVLRDRKRLQGKIKAMSSEAKASAMIIGSLPPAVMGMVWLSTPSYIDSLFTERMGNLMLLGCGIWMTVGIFVMKKMISFKH